MKLATLLVVIDVLAWTLFAESPFGKEFLETHVVVSLTCWIACGLVVIALCRVADGGGAAIRAFFNPQRATRAMRIPRHGSSLNG